MPGLHIGLRKRPGKQSGQGPVHGRREGGARHLTTERTLSLPGAGPPLLHQRAMSRRPKLLPKLEYSAGPSAISASASSRHLPHRECLRPERATVAIHKAERGLSCSGLPCQRLHSLAQRRCCQRLHSLAQQSRRRPLLRRVRLRSPDRRCCDCEVLDPGCQARSSKIARTLGSPSRLPVPNGGLDSIQFEGSLTRAQATAARVRADRMGSCVHGASHAASSHHKVVVASLHPCFQHSSCQAVPAHDAWSRLQQTPCRQAARGARGQARG